jgi:hypothetical protein
MVPSRHDHADDDVDDEQQCAQRAPHARALTLSASVPPDRLRSAAPHEVDDGDHDENDYDDADDPEPSDSR